jgi:hypothetical protein
MKELMFPLSQQIFLPSRSAAVAGVAIAGDNKTKARVEPVASDKRTFAIISDILSVRGTAGRRWRVHAQIKHSLGA